jgi:hypothetical protein
VRSEFEPKYIAFQDLEMGKILAGLTAHVLERFSFWIGCSIFWGTLSGYAISAAFNWNRRTALTTNGIPYAWIWISLAALGIVQAAFFNSLRKFRRKLSMSEDAVVTMVYILALKLVETMALTTQ